MLAEWGKRMKGNWGYYPTGGKVSVDWHLRYPCRKMRLTSSLEYIDKRDTSWIAPSGSDINGASTGWFFRRLFPAYVGFYRRASVLHDVACKNKYRPSWIVHRMFYEVSRYDIMVFSREIENPLDRWLWVAWSIAKAWVMRAAVRLFGPRFPGTEKG